MIEERWQRILETLGGRDRSVREGGFCRDLWREVAETGLFAVLPGSAPGECMAEAVTRFRELGRVSPDRGLTFSAVTQLASTVFCLTVFGSRELRERYLPAAQSGAAIGGHAITEAEAGSDVMNMSTTAVRRGDHYVLTGSKRFITNAPIATTLVVYAKTEGDGPEGGLSAFLVETGWPGVGAAGAMPTAGLRSAPIGEVHLDGVKVPEANRVGHPGAGMLILDQVMKREILLAFAANVGEMERSVRESVDYANQRVQFGAPIGGNQLVADRLVEAQIAIELGGTLLESIAAKIDGYSDVTIPIAAAKVFISEAHLACALNSIRIRGGNGYLDTEPYCADLLDAVPGTIYSGSNDVLRTKIATMMGIKT
ncbi:acyl-CoA dehydrogenase family protein [Plantactinospora sp. WMMB334]|uniref:acyl-CoA dehydrogenase family protein n=1 Tax=Plantactinospora sp. WMMB334 TaxID=3404119 RepID=UPI003B949FA7